LNITTDLTGSYQQDNIATVLTAVEILINQGWPLKLDKAADALRAVKSTTGLRGRWDVLQNSPLIIADVAHNPAGLQTVLKDWKHIPAKKKHIVVGFVRDKDIRTALALFPADVVYHFCAADNPRALPAAELAAIAAEAGLIGMVYPSVTEAVETAKSLLHKEDALLITGSFFIVGEAMQTFSGMAGE
jgi:dihydrofolate synthase/folylpolyglutamate synthase